MAPCVDRHRLSPFTTLFSTVLPCITLSTRDPLFQARSEGLTPSLRCATETTSFLLPALAPLSFTLLSHVFLFLIHVTSSPV